MEVAPEDKQPADAKEPLLVEKLDRLHLQHGREVYTRQCSGCHGTTGDGKGPAAAYLNPPPRDYRLGRFKFTSTPRGAKPRREDLARIIRHGAKGTSMPTFRWMAQDDLEAVIDYVMLLSSRGEVGVSLDEVCRAATWAKRTTFDPQLVAEQAQLIAQSWADADTQIVRPLTPQPTVHAGIDRRRGEGLRAAQLLQVPRPRRARKQDSSTWARTIGGGSLMRPT